MCVCVCVCDVVCAHVYTWFCDLHTLIWCITHLLYLFPLLLIAFPQQQVGYVGVEPLVDNKAAVVSILVQLPGKPENGRPRQGQTGVCFGSALVRIKTKPSSSAGNKKKKRIFKRKRNGHPSSTSSNGESRSAQHGQEASTDV